MSIILAFAAGQVIAGQSAATQAAAQTPTTAERATGPGALGQQSGSPLGSSPGIPENQLPSATKSAVLPSVTQSDNTASATAQRFETVTSRRRPEYDPAGIRTGALQIFPEVSATVGYDNNVYRQVSGVSDGFGRLRAAVLARTDLSRHAIIADGYVDQRLYSKYSTEDALTYNAHVLGRLDFARGDMITAEVQRTRAVVERGTAGEILNTREPIRYDYTLASIEGRKAFGRFSLGLGGAVSYSDFENAETPDRIPVDQQFRDFTLYQVRTDAGYALAAGPEVFVSVTGEARRNRLNTPPVNRDTDSIEVLGGVRGNITPLLRGQLGVGYIRASFKDRTIESRGALGVNIRLDYIVTPLTTVRVTARRDLRNVASLTSPAALVTEGRIGVDHELLRNVILSADVGYQYADYINLDGSVRRLTADGSAQWLMNRRIRVNFDLGYQGRDGSARALNQQFDQVRASIGFAYRL